KHGWPRPPAVCKTGALPAKTRKPPQGGFFVPQKKRQKKSRLGAACKRQWIVRQAVATAPVRVAYFSSSGSKQASTTCKWLSRAKFKTKSQAMGSCSRSSARSTTHFTPLMVVGMHQGE